MSSAYGLTEGAKHRQSVIADLNKQINDLEQIKESGEAHETYSPNATIVPEPVITEPRYKKKKEPSLARKGALSSSFLSCDRERSFVYAPEKERKQVPGSGYYNPTYGQVQNRTQITFIPNRGGSRRRKAKRFFKTKLCPRALESSCEMRKLMRKGSQGELSVIAEPATQEKGRGAPPLHEEQGPLNRTAGAANSQDVVLPSSSIMKRKARDAAIRREYENGSYLRDSSSDLAKCHLSFEKQISRNQANKRYEHSLSDARFENVNLTPQICSKFRREDRGPNFSRASGRTQTLWNK